MIPSNWIRYRNRITKARTNILHVKDVAMERIPGLLDVHLDKHAIFTNLVAIPAIAIYVIALLDKRKTDYGGYMTYKQGFISGIIITLIKRIPRGSAPGSKKIII